MPEKKTVERAQADARQGKAPSTQAGEFVREEMEHIRKGKHGARSTKQAIAIGLSKARRSGVKLPPPAKGKASERTRVQAERDIQRSRGRRVSPKRSRARRSALQHEGKQAASRNALARQARTSARGRSRKSRTEAARKAVRTKGKTGLRQAAQKAARTRAARAA